MHRRILSWDDIQCILRAMGLPTKSEWQLECDDNGLYEFHVGDLEM